MFFFFNDTATTEIYTLSLHDALPIFFPIREAADLTNIGILSAFVVVCVAVILFRYTRPDEPRTFRLDRKSTRLNSSHANISYAVFCLKKKKTLCMQFSFVSLVSITTF